MVDRPAASSGGARPARPGALPATESHQHTARIAVRSQLPGWLWGVMGCLTVLGVGFAALFVLMGPGAGPATPAAVITAAPSAPAAAPAPAKPAGIQVEPMAAPPPPPPPIVAHPSKPKAAPDARRRPVKVARSPGAARAAGEDVVEEEAEDADPEEAPAPKPKTKTAARERAPAAEETEEN
jgi:hypothetical protein